MTAEELFRRCRQRFDSYRCECGSRKRTDKWWCVDCYQSLPANLREFWRMNTGDQIATLWHRGVEWLKANTKRFESSQEGEESWHDR